MKAWSTRAGRRGRVIGSASQGPVTCHRGGTETRWHGRYHRELQSFTYGGMGREDGQDIETLVVGSQTQDLCLYLSHSVCVCVCGGGLSVSVMSIKLIPLRIFLLLLSLSS